jgi:hypothetical protein
MPSLKIVELSRLPAPSTKYNIERSFVVNATRAGVCARTLIDAVNKSTIAREIPEIRRKEFIIFSSENGVNGQNIPKETF